MSSTPISPTFEELNAVAAAEAIRDVMSVSRLLTPPTLSSPEVVHTQNTEAAASSGGAAQNTDTESQEDTPMADTKEYEESTDGTDLVEAPPLDREFICLNDEYSECRTGQYTKDLARKVISHHFGRNKACTRDITNWPLFCRKHYQRATYNSHLWQLRKVTLILRQFDIIEREHPGTTYDVVFKKSEESRLNEFSRKVASGVPMEEATAAVAPTVGKHFEAPIDVLRELEYCLGRNKSMDQAREAVNIILDMLHKKETKEVPAIEFLPQLPKKGKATAKCAKNVGASSASPLPSKASSSRVSAKGAVKKTSRGRKAA